MHPHFARMMNNSVLYTMSFMLSWIADEKSFQWHESLGVTVPAHWKAKVSLAWAKTQLCANAIANMPKLPCERLRGAERAVFSRKNFTYITTKNASLQRLQLCHGESMPICCCVAVALLCCWFCFCFVLLCCCCLFALLLLCFGLFWLCLCLACVVALNQLFPAK